MTRSTLLLVALTLIACTAAPPADDIRDRDWQLVSVDRFTSVPAGAATPTLRFGTDGRAGGNTGCNTAGAAYTLEGTRLTLERVISTKRACIADEANALERAYLDALEATRSYRLTAGELELLGEDGRVVARFR